MIKNDVLQYGIHKQSSSEREKMEIVDKMGQEYELVREKIEFADELGKLKIDVRKKDGKYDLLFKGRFIRQGVKVESLADRASKFLTDKLRELAMILVTEAQLTAAKVVDNGYEDDEETECEGIDDRGILEMSAQEERRLSTDMPN